MKTNSLGARIKRLIGSGRFYRLLWNLRYRTLGPVRHLSRALTWRGVYRGLAAQPSGVILHLGCGDDRRQGMLNCEFRATAGCDAVMDCSKLDRFDDATVSGIYSNAFFEHLYRTQHASFASECFRVLGPNGWAVSLALPDFRAVAEAYLSNAPGIVGDRFDLFNVYRYTHGDPEAAPLWWLEQLHKSLLDDPYLRKLWHNAGFKYVGICNYCYPGESLAVNLAVVASKTGPVDCLPLFEPFADRFADHRIAASSVTWSSLN
jgi:hypothetical protein